MASKLSVRAATVEDAPRIADVHYRSSVRAYRGLIPEPFVVPIPLERRVARWSEALNNIKDSECVFVAEQDGVIAGFLRVCPCRDNDVDAEIVGEVSTMYVDPEYWRQGLGHALMTRARDELVTRGFAEAKLWVLELNERARRFYEQLGWTPDGRSKLDEYLGTSVTEIRYEVGL